MLNVKWGDETADGSVTGMVDGFVGADGESRDWSVTLNEADIANATGTFADPDNGTVWTMGVDQAGAAGSWSGTFYEAPAAGDYEGTPTTALGEFRASHGNVGQMAGAFGATHEGP